MFLDEPTLGLDPTSREIMWKYIKRLIEEEKITIILTTHYMEEAESLCDRIGIIDKGQIIAMDTPSKLIESVGGEKIIIKFKEPDSSSINNIENRLKRFNFIHKIENSPKENTMIVYVDNANDNLPEVIKEINKQNAVDIQSIDFKIPTLNDVFINYTGRRIVDKDSAEGGFMERYAQYGR
jgi:ABC-2 type transport system ATP-binding protein